MSYRQSTPEGYGSRKQIGLNHHGHYGFIDNAKAIGIVLIVLGHSKGLPEYLSRLIFSFHVPLFFFISGFLINAKKLDATIVSNTKKILLTLGIPYVLFFMVAFLYWLVTRNMGAKAFVYAGTAWYTPMVGLFTGLESDLYIDPPLWFFPCFMLTAIAYHASRKLLSTAGATCLFVVFACAVSLLWKYASYRLPLGLDNMWIALSFYAIGQSVREKNFFLQLKSSYVVLVLLTASTLLIYAELINTKVDLANMHFGLWPILYVPTALAGIIATLSISYLLPTSRISNWLSKNTLTIFPVHFVCFSIVRGAATSLHLIPIDYNYGIAWSVVSSALAILLCIPFLYVIPRLPLPVESFGRARVRKAEQAL